MYDLRLWPASLASPSAARPTITPENANASTANPKSSGRSIWARPKTSLQPSLQASSTAPAARPDKALVTEFGAVAALYDLCQRLCLVEHIDRHAPKKGQGPSVGTYLLVAVLNRCVAPCSKASIADWFQTTVLRHLVPIQSRQLSSQHFWDNMDRLSPRILERIETDLVAHMVREFDVDLARVIFDATNFFTFIDTFNERSTVAQPGHSKQQRASLRIVGLALLVSTDFHLPLFQPHLCWQSTGCTDLRLPDLTAGPTLSHSHPGHTGDHPDFRQRQQFPGQSGGSRREPLPFHRITGSHTAPRSALGPSDRVSLSGR